MRQLPAPRVNPKRDLFKVVELITHRIELISDFTENAFIAVVN